MKMRLRERRISRNTWAAWRPKPVVDHRMIQSCHGGVSKYYLCPSCSILLSREYVNYCDDCGQKLGWEAVEEEELRLEQEACY